MLTEPRALMSWRLRVEGQSGLCDEAVEDGRAVLEALLSACVPGSGDVRADPGRRRFEGRGGGGGRGGGVQGGGRGGRRSRGRLLIVRDQTQNVSCSRMNSARWSSATPASRPSKYPSRGAPGANSRSIEAGSLDSLRKACRPPAGT